MITSLQDVVNWCHCIGYQTTFKYSTGYIPAVRSPDSGLFVPIAFDFYRIIPTLGIPNWLPAVWIIVSQFPLSLPSTFSSTYFLVYTSLPSIFSFVFVLSFFHWLPAVWTIIPPLISQCTFSLPSTFFFCLFSTAGALIGLTV